MNYLGLLDELFEDAKKNGIRRMDIGRQMYGESGRTKVYLLKNVTLKTLQRCSDAIEELKKLKKSISYKKV